MKSRKSSLVLLFFWVNPGTIQVMFLPQGCILVLWYGRNGLAVKSTSAFEDEKC